MGIGKDRNQIAFEQMQNYYIFQKKLYSVLNNEQNSALFNCIEEKFQIQEAYIIDANWIKSWKSFLNYNIAKDSYDKIIFSNEDDLKQQMNVIFTNLIYDELIQ